MSLENRQQLLDVTQGLLDGKEDFLEGIRKINSLRHEMDDPENEVFEIFQVIDSETIELPDLSSRKLYQKEFLQKAEAKIHEIFLFYKNDTFESCEKILETYK